MKLLLSPFVAILAAVALPACQTVDHDHHDHSGHGHDHSGHDHSGHGHADEAHFDALEKQLKE